MPYCTEKKGFSIFGLKSYCKRKCQNKNLFVSTYKHILCLDKQYADEQIRAFNPSKKPIIKNMVLSMTSYPERMKDMHYAIFSILNQSIQPEKFILWLAASEFPNGEQNVPENVLQFKKYGLEIRFTEAIRSFKKIIPALENFSDKILVSADDDIFYPENWLKELYSSYRKNHTKIYAHRMHKVCLENGNIKEYSCWDKCIIDRKGNYLNFPTSVGGILYPPNIFKKEAVNKNSFLKLCPNQDDVWVWSMAVLNNVKICSCKNPMNNDLIYINPERELCMNGESTLAQINLNGENDKQIKNVVNYYNLLGELKMNKINVCFVTDENYAPYMGTVIYSIICNAKHRNNFVFHVFDNGIKEKTKKKLKKIAKNNEINFIDASSFAQRLESLPQTAPHITKSSYLKFIIADVLKDLDKVLYLDCDLIVTRDIQELYDTDIGNNLIGAVEDVGYTYWSKSNEDLKLKFKCMNSGVMLINCDLWRKENLSQTLMECASDHDKVGFGQDQPVLNFVCKNRVFFLPFKWNAQDTFFRDSVEIQDRMDIKECHEARDNPAIIHYTYVRKPWNDFDVVRARDFWKYHKKNPMGNHPSFWNVQRIRLLSHITFGKTRKHYKEKWKKIKWASKKI